MNAAMTAASWVRRSVIGPFSGSGGPELAVERCGEPEYPANRVDMPRPPGVKFGFESDRQAAATLAVSFPDVSVIDDDITGLSTCLILHSAGLGDGDAALVGGEPPCIPFSESGPVRRREGQIVRRTAYRRLTELIARCDRW